VPLMGHVLKSMSSLKHGPLKCHVPRRFEGAIVREYDGDGAVRGPATLSGSLIPVEEAATIVTVDA
jgi:hypothetical protein